MRVKLKGIDFDDDEEFARFFVAVLNGGFTSELSPEKQAEFDARYEREFKPELEKRMKEVTKNGRG